MKKYLFILSLVLLTSKVWSQETINLMGGFVLARPVDYDTEATGFRITGTYEIGPMEAKRLIHGFSLAYINTAADVAYNNLKGDLKVRSWSMYYAPKYMIGTEKVMAFARASVGIQFAHLQAGGDIEGDDRDWGFYGGVGLGGMAYVSERVYINLEYEWAYMTNNYYLNGILNSFQVGIGIDL